MANGTIHLGYSKNIQGRIVWSSTKDIATNSSVITAYIQVMKDTDIATTGTWKGALNVGGTTKDFAYWDSVGNNWITILFPDGSSEITITKYHNQDGTGSCYISGQIDAPSGTTQAGASVYGNETVTLDTIPREASLTSAPNFTDEENPVIKYSNDAGSAAKLEACISLDGSADDIAYRTISATGTSYTFNLTTAERNVLRNACKDANSRKVRFYLRSTIAGTEYLTYLEKTLTIVNAYPTFTASVNDIDADMLALTGDSNKIVRYYSNPQYSVSATALKGASIKSYKVVCGSETKTTNTGTFYNVSSNTITVTVTDTRGNWTKKTITKTLVPYVKLTCNLAGNTPDTQGNFDFTVKGNYFNSTFGKVANTLNVYYRYKSSGDYTDWIPLTITLDGNTYSATTTLTGLDYRATYTFQAYAEDQIAKIETEEKPIRSTPVFDWSENDFNVNVDFSLNGKSVLRVNGENNNTVLSAEDAANGVFIRPNGTGSSTGQVYFDTDGKMHTSKDFVILTHDDNNNMYNTFQSFTNNVCAVGYGGYTAGIGQTTIYGNDVFIRSKDKFYINGVAYDGNKVLWSGGSFMSGSQSVTLSENISAQANGIVLVFSRYSNGTSENANFNTFFVPKQQIATHSGAGMAFNMFTVNFSVACCKYLYINDNTISGNDLNTATGTGTTGIKYENNAYVLRYVIGV